MATFTDMILKMLELSTAHITKETSEWLQDSCFIMEHALQVPDIVAYNKMEYGFFIPVLQSYFEDDAEVIPPDLKSVYDFAKVNKCDWIMLDRDAEVINELPVYDW